MSLDLCNLDLLICFTNYLDVHDILAFSSCDRRLYLLLGVESIWKRLCRVNFGITYNHPNQLYRILYQNSYQQKYGRLPCQHISNIQIDFNLLLCEFQRLNLDNINNTIQSNEDNNNDENNIYNFVSCSQCYTRGVENLFLCVHPGCRKIVCDNHSRIHARVHNSNQHGIFFKPNTCELYCHTCVDWVSFIIYLFLLLFFNSQH
ncbi:hypothetical protein BJ944DRAFT_267244 [Cunninghamella echinulata]|nr:hypothetical protein BJ944DRAFT_267244 [Cunninghamella echinulata]